MSDIVTSRLRLAPFRMEDATDLFGIRGDGEAMVYWDWPADESVEQTHAIAASMLTDVENGSAVFWTVRLAADARFAGICDLSEIDGSGTGDLGFMFGRCPWVRASPAKPSPRSSSKRRAAASGQFAHGCMRTMTVHAGFLPLLAFRWPLPLPISRSGQA